METTTGETGYSISLSLFSSGMGCHFTVTWVLDHFDIAKSQPLNLNEDYATPLLAIRSR